jgi:hypothetical protein
MKMLRRLDSQETLDSKRGTKEEFIDCLDLRKSECIERIRKLRDGYREIDLKLKEMS